MDTIAYYITLSTSTETYSIIYVNHICKLSISSDIFFNNSENVTVNDDTLTISFEMASSSETYESIMAEAQYLKLSMKDLMDSLSG